MTPEVRSLLRGAAVVGAVGTIALGALSIVGLLGWETVRVQRTYADVRVVDVDVSVESVRVQTGPEGASGAVRLDRSMSWSMNKPSISQHLVGHRLVVRSSGAIWFGRGMDGRVTLVVPAGVRLQLHSSGGFVKVVGSTGRVSATSSAGSVTGTALGSADVAASSSAGSVRLDFVADPIKVKARSSAGSVVVQVPRDEAAYAVDASTSAGSRTVSVRTDPGATRRITARSSAGSVRVSYLPTR